MIKLRWVVIGKQRELQYKQWKVRIDASGAITPLPMPIEWTKWERVEHFKR